MTPLVTLLTGVAVGAVSTWIYDRSVTVPRVRRKAKAEVIENPVAPETEKLAEELKAEEATVDEDGPVRETTRIWRMPNLRRNRPPAPGAMAETVTETPEDDAPAGAAPTAV